MKEQILSIASDLREGFITTKEAQKLLSELLKDDESLYDMLAAKNNLIETDTPNVWVKNEPNRKNDILKATYTLTKLGFVVKFHY